MQSVVTVARCLCSRLTGNLWGTKAGGGLVTFFLVVILLLSAAAVARADDPLVPDVNLEAAIRAALDKWTGDLTVADLQGLEQLDADGLGIVDLEGLQHCSSLTYLNLAVNEIADVGSLGGAVALEYLDLSDNEVEGLWPLSGLGDMIGFNAAGNRISDISVVDQMGNLQWLDLSENQVADISPLENLGNLEWLDLHDNQVADLAPVQDLSQLRYLDLSDNQVADLSPLSGFDFSCLRHLDLSDNQIAAFSSPVGFDFQELAYLDLSENDIDDISALNNLYELEHLDLYGNWVDDISALENMWQLTYLELGDNELSTLPWWLGNLHDLWHLGLSDNLLSSLDGSNLSNLDTLRSLDLSDNWLSDANDLNGMSSLEELDLSGNNINSLNSLWGLDRLVWLDLSDNELQDANGLDNLNALQTLDLSDNELQDTNGLDNLNALQALNLSGNKLSDLYSLPNSAALRSLDVSWNELQNIDELGDLMNLEELNLHGNQVQYIGILENLASLAWLDLGMNQIYDIEGLQGLTNLGYLNLQWNEVQDIEPLVDNFGLGDGDTVDLRGNPLDPDVEEQQIPFLRFRGVEVLWDGPSEPLEVVVRRGIDYGVPGTFLDDHYEYSVEIIGDGIRDIELTTPWSEEVHLEELLGCDWPTLDSGAFFRGPLAVHVWHDGDTPHVEFRWDALTDDRWSALETTPAQLVIWRGAQQVILSPSFVGGNQPTQEPLPTMPGHRAVEAGNLIARWSRWSEPPQYGFVEASIAEIPRQYQWTGSEYAEGAFLAAGAVGWDPPDLPTSMGYYEFEISYVSGIEEHLPMFTIRKNSRSENGAHFVVTEAADDHGNTSATATPLPAPATVGGAIEYWGDIDWFALPAIEGTTYDIRVDLAAGPSVPVLDDSVLWLYDTDGRTRLGWDDDGGHGWGSRLVWTAPADGTYFIAVDAFDLDNQLGAYTLEVTQSIVEADAPKAVFDHSGQVVLAYEDRIVAVSDRYTGATRGEGATLHLLDVDALTDDAKPHSPELSTFFSREFEGGTFVNNGQGFCYGDDSNAWGGDGQDGWSEIVLLDLSADMLMPIGWYRCRRLDVGGLAADGDWVYAATQDENESRVFIETYQLNWPALDFEGISEPIRPPAAVGGDFGVVSLLVQGGRACLLHENGVVSILDVNSTPAQLLGQIVLDERIALSGLAVLNDTLWVGDGWNLRSFDLSNPGSPQPLTITPMGGRVGDVVVRGDLVFVGVAGLGVKVVDLADPPKPGALPIAHTFVADTATGSFAIARGHLIVPTGRWQTAIFPLFEVWLETEDGLDWVYQNTNGTLRNGGHEIRLEVNIRDFAGNSSIQIASIQKVSGSGSGLVVIENDPGGDPMVRYICGSMRTNGTIGTGPLTLQVTVLADVSGQVVLDLPLTVRPLGDVDGNGAPEPGDVSLLIMKLNGTPPAGYDDRAFDLDANGGSEPGDVQILNNILNGLPVP